MPRAEFTAIRERAGLTKAALASLLRVTPRNVRQLEAGERKVSGPVSLLMELLASGVLRHPTAR